MKKLKHPGSLVLLLFFAMSGCGERSNIDVRISGDTVILKITGSVSIATNGGGHFEGRSIFDSNDDYIGHVLRIVPNKKHIPTDTIYFKDGVIHTSIGVISNVCISNTFDTMFIIHKNQ